MESKDPRRRSIYFGKSESKVLEYALSQPGNFATYVKSLIIKDMQKEPFEQKVIQIIEKYMKDKNITTNLQTGSNSDNEVEFNNSDIDALKKLMKG